MSPSPRFPVDVEGRKVLGRGMGGEWHATFELEALYA